MYIESHIASTSREDIGIDCSPDDIRIVLSANAQPDIHSPSEDENVLCANVSNLGIDCDSNILPIDDPLPIYDLPNTLGDKETTLYSTDEQHITQTESEDDQQREPVELVNRSLDLNDELQVTSVDQSRRSNRVSKPPTRLQLEPNSKS